jgi:hypothetical protein
MTSSPEGQATLDAALAREIVRAIASLRYGTLELTLHDGRVVQVERREKIRLSEPPRPPST